MHGACMQQAVIAVGEPVGGAEGALWPAAQAQAAAGSLLDVMQPFAADERTDVHLRTRVAHSCRQLSPQIVALASCDGAAVRCTPAHVA
jgi:hypothetical protein